MATNDTNSDLQSRDTQDNDSPLAGLNRIAFKSPEFNPEDPELWLALMNSAFHSAGIAGDTSQYTNALGALPKNVHNDLRDLILSLPRINKFETLTAALLKRFGSTPHQKTQQLLEREELGNRKPTQFLRHLKKLAGDATPEHILKSIWLSRLPLHLQSALAAREDALDHLAEIADLIFEVTAKTSSSINVAQTAPPSSSPSSAVGFMDRESRETINALAEELRKLNTRQINPTFQRNKRVAQRPRNNMNSRANPSMQNIPPARDTLQPRGNNQSGNNFKLCYAHYQYGARARNCKPPCAWPKKSFNTPPEN